MIDDFVKELEDKAPRCGRHWKHGETLFKFKVNGPTEVRFQNLISFDPHGLLSFFRFIFPLADKHGVTITGKAQPTTVGPSVTKNACFFVGMEQERLLRLYQKFDFEVHEEQGFYQVIRRPKNEVHSQED